MVGLIWVMQIVHYPLFAQVGEATYGTFQTEHMQRITKVLFVPWGIEALTTLALVLVAPTPKLRAVALIGAALFAAVTLITALLAAPIHGRLVDGFDAVEHGRLLSVNWARTALWTARGAVALAVVWWSISTPVEVSTPVEASTALEVSTESE